MNYSHSENQHANHPDAFLNILAEVITEGLLQDGFVRLHRFGVFRLKWHVSKGKKQRITGKIKFTPSNRIRRIINPNPAPLIPLVISVQEGEYIKPDFKPAGLPLYVQQQAVCQKNNIDKPKQESGAAEVQEVKPQEFYGSLSSKLPRNAGTPLQSELERNFSAPERVQLDKSSSIEENIKQREYRLASGGLIFASVVAILVVALPGPETELGSPSSGAANQDANPEQVVENSNSEHSTVNYTLSKEQTVGSKSREGEVSENTSGGLDENLIDASSGTETPTGILEKSVEKMAAVNPEPYNRAATADKGGFFKPATHSVNAGDNLWDLAHKYYGDHYLWPYIYLANKEVLQHPDSLPANMQLIIPGLQQAPNRLNPKDKSLIQRGYLQVYENLKAQKSPNADFFLTAAEQYSGKGD